MRLYFLFIALLLSTTASAAEIVRFIPECTQNEIKNQRVEGSSSFREIPKNQYIQDLPTINYLRKKLISKAQEQQMDGVLLRELVFIKDLDKRNVYQTVLYADFFQYCNDNNRLSTQTALLYPFQKLERRLESKGIEFALNTNVRALSQVDVSQPQLASYNASQPASMDVNLDSSFGLQLGDSQETIHALWGFPGAQLPLQHHEMLWLYGRQTALWFDADKNLKAVFFGHAMLSGYGINLIEWHPKLDETPWLAWQKYPVKSELENMQALLKQAVEQPDGDWLFTKENRQLHLKFADFNPLGSNTSLRKLTGFTFNSLEPLPDSIVIQQQNASERQALLQRLSHTLQGDVLMQTEVPNLATMPWVVERAETVWYVPTDQLQLQFSNQQLKKIRIADPLYKNPQAKDLRWDFMQAIGMPTVKQELLAKYPMMQDNGDRLTLSSSAFDVEIQLASEQPDAKVDVIEISLWHLP